MEYAGKRVAFEDFVAELGDVLHLWPTRADSASRTLRGITFWVPGHLPSDAETLVIVPYSPHGEGDGALVDALASPNSRVWVLCGWPAKVVKSLVPHDSRHAVLRSSHTEDITEVVSAFSRLAQPPSVAELRRLTTIQRSFSQAFEHTDTISELLRRLQRLTNAVCLVIDGQGRVRESMGSLPLSLFVEQIRKTEASTQHVSVDGWEGNAVRLKAAGPHQQDLGWLIVAARRPDFPTDQDAAATHIAATLIETAHRMQVATQQQADAIRASILDGALALSPEPDSPELANRMRALGIEFGSHLRIVVAAPRLHPQAASKAVLLRLQQPFKAALEAADVSHLITTRETATVYLVQADVDTIQRMLRIHRDELRPLNIGIGRPISSVGDIPSAYADALVGIRTIQAGRHTDSHMAFEEFDFATRVFASVGLETMVKSSRTFLAPILEREPMLQALRRYFEHAQNTSATADSLGIHHNTLRYRLAKVEELLEVTLNDPAAIASLFLAITSLDLVDLQLNQQVTHAEAQTHLSSDEGITPSGISPAVMRSDTAAGISSARPPRARRY